MPVLSGNQSRGLRRIGDVMIPGDGEMPSFSASGCATHADRMLDHMYDDDRASVCAVLTLCAFLPRFAIRGLLSLTEKHGSAPEPVAGLLRMANLGIKGVVMSLYYADVGTGRVFEKMKWDPVVHQKKN
jgi:hypothetical protein